MAAATSCHSTALFLLPTRQESRYAVVSSYSSGQSRLSQRFGLSFRAERGFKARKPVVVSSLRDDSKTVTSKTWDKLILESNTPVLVEFYANWCGPCRMVHRVIDEIANDYSGLLKCFLLDADNDPQIAEKYEIKAVPVVLLFKNGEKREAVMGTMPKEYYVAAIERVMAS